MTQITTGMVYQADKSRLCVSKINQDSQVVLMTDLTTKHDFPITITDFQRGIAQGLYVRENLEKDTSRSHSRVIDDPRFKSEYVTEARRRQLAISKFDRLVNEGMSAVEAGNKVISIYGLQCSERTFRRWRGDFLKVGFEGIAPKHHCKGRKKIVLPEEVVEVIESTLNEYASKHYLRVTELHQIINQNLKKKGLEVTLSYDQVRKIFNAMPWNERVLKKFDPRTRRSVGSMRQRNYQTNLPYQRIEMDCTQLDVFVTQPLSYQPIRPWVCAAIDVATGFPLATEISLHAPDTVQVLKTLERAMYGFTEDEFEEYGVINRIAYMGRPQTLVLDNGSEFRSDSFSSITSFGIAVEYNPAFSPYRKPFIERFNKSLKDFTSSLPGSTRGPKTTNARPQTELGMKTAIIDFKELKMLITRFVFDEYSIRSLDRHVISSVARGEDYGVSPAQRLVRLQKEMIALEPITMEDMANARMIRETRTTDRGGITFEKCKFSSSEYAVFYSKLGPGVKVEILYDPIDCTYIDVIDPTNKGSKIRLNNIYWDIGRNPPVDYSTLKILMAEAYKNHGRSDRDTIAVEYQKRLGIFFDGVNKRATTKTKKHSSAKKEVAEAAKLVRSMTTGRTAHEQEIDEPTYLTQTSDLKIDYESIEAPEIVTKKNYQ
ncbi:MAG: Mu transposase C-terminal domain-containing protein [Limnobacter sp.]|uniref:Mu transposase C-terminal domain-containing protein n=1 Tax=Limnobacter sp. TaxID=2003368 RepID=UPI0040377B2D